MDPDIVFTGEGSILGGMTDSPVGVLLVEDAETDIAAARRILRRFPVNLTVAHNGHEALRLLSPETGTYLDPPRIVLLDLSLPGMHGLDILRKIKTDETTRHLVVIILTADQKETTAMECYRLRCDGVLTKPLTLANVEVLLARFGLTPVLSDTSRGR